MGFASVGVATVGVATFGGSYQTVKPHDKILMPANNDVALNEIGSNGYITIDVSQETVALERLVQCLVICLLMYH